MTEPAPASVGRLYLVATPIGNLEDISLRALRVLKSADLIAAEDTRRTRKLLTHYQISTPLISCYKDNEQARTPDLIQRVRDGRQVAVVTDAGTPGISDPGFLLAAEARRRGLAVEVVPGPSAVLAALLASGLPPQPFSFHGFLESRPGPRRKTLLDLKTRPETQVFFLSPHRLAETLKDVEEIWGDRPAALCRELTKMHEEVIAAGLSALRAHSAQTPGRGEYTLVVQGHGGRPQSPATESLEEQLVRLQAEGLSLNQAVARAARERGLDRKEVYRRAHQAKED